MSDGKLIRRLLPFERDFAQIPNDWMRDGRLSFKARGLLAMLMTHKEGWAVSLTTIVNDATKDGKDSVLAAVRELEALGYVVRHRRRAGGRFSVDDWELADPSGIHDPGLFGYAQAGGISPRRKNRGGSTATVNPPGTVADFPPPLRTLEEDIEAPSAPYVRGPSYPQEPAPRECHVSPRVSPSGKHERTPSGVCVNCSDELPKAIGA